MQNKVNAVILLSRKNTYNSISLQMKMLGNHLVDCFGEKVLVAYSDQEKEYTNHTDIKIIKSYGMYIRGLFFKDLSNYIFVFHNITPPRHFLFSEPKVALLAAIGYIQLWMLKFKKINWVAVSEYNKSILQKLGHKNIIVCPNIVESVKKISREEKFSVPSLLYVGRIVENKDCIELLLKVFQVAKQIDSEIDFYIVGKGKKGSRYLQKFENLIKQKPDNLNILWEDSLPYSSLVHLYQKSWLYITMSKHEGFGLPVCESVSNGTPALYTKCGGQESVMNNVGLCLDNNMESEILKLLRSKEHLNSLYIKQSFIVKQYQMPQIRHTIESVYRRIIFNN